MDAMTSIKRGLSSLPVWLLIGCLLSVSTPAGAGQLDDSLKTALRTMGPDDRVPVIIVFAEQPAPVVLPQSAGRQDRFRHLGDRIRSLRTITETHRHDVNTLLGNFRPDRMRSLWLINSLAANLKRDDIRRLAEMPEVAEIRSDRMYRKEDLLQAIGDSPEANITQVGAPDLWTLGHYGQGTTVGLMDSGADVNHPDLAPTWRGGTNSWFDPYGEYAVPFDSDAHGHGTGVLGIMVGRNAGGTTIGMAPKARWIAARLFDSAGYATDSAILRIFQWFLDPDGNPSTDDAPDVINGSWGYESSYQNQCLGVDLDNNGIPDLQEIITTYNNYGIASVFAAGNYGPGGPSSISPANYTGAIAVGAVDESDVVTDASSRGPGACDDRIYPDVVAPGENTLMLGVKTSDRTLGLPIPAYAYRSGTSFSAPHVSGGLALLAGAFPNATLADLKSALFDAAVDLGDPGPDNDYGNGRVNIYNADPEAGAYVYLRDTLALTPCVRPDISFSADPKPAAINEQITFTAEVDGSGGPYTYDWDVNGDGVSDYYTSSIQLSYGSAYTGSVKLTVTEAGCASELIVADQWACPAISVSIGTDANPILVGQPVTFTGAISGNGTPPYSYAWDLDGDGAVDVTKDGIPMVEYTYPAAGTVDVALTITDSSGCTASSQLAIEVQQPPLPGGDSGGCFLSIVMGSGS